MTFFLLFVIAVGVSAYLFWMGETRMSGEAAAARAYDDRTLAAALDLSALRSAQQAYVAAGQGESFWTDRVTALLGTSRASLAAIRADSVAPGAQSSLDTAIASLDAFERLDRRAQSYLRNDQRLLASDVVFGDAIDVTNAALAAVDGARGAERAARQQVMDGIRRRQLFAVGSGAAAALLVTLLLLPTGPRREEDDEVLHVAGGLSQPAEAFDAGVEVEDGWSRAVPTTATDVPPAPVPEPVSEAPPAPVVAAPEPPAPGPEPVPLVDLPGVAAVCTDLARLADTRSLPALLERAAEALDAEGIILWIADPDGRELSPIVTHGYSPNLVTRLGTILRDAENATAAAFRTSLLQTVKTDAFSCGAIAAPLVTPGGCVGVMAAEVRREGEQQPARLAAATIVAAQLATLVGPPSSRARAEATG